jgi:DNA-binding transcriptional MerR regulator
MEIGTEIRSVRTVTKATKRNDNAGDAKNDQEIWRIGDLAKEFDLTLRTLRFYEDRGLLKPARKGNTRLYSRRDRARLKLIVSGRKVGFSVREIKQMIDLYEPQGNNVRQLKVALQKATKQMERLTKQREAIDEAIGELSQSMAIVRKKLLDNKNRD